MIHIDIPLSSLITSKSLTTNGSSPWQCDLPLPVLHPGRRKLACMPCLSLITFLLLRRKKNKCQGKERLLLALCAIEMWASWSQALIMGKRGGWNGHWLRDLLPLRALHGSLRIPTGQLIVYNLKCHSPIWQPECLHYDEFCSGFPIKNFSLYYLTCYSTKTWVHGPLPLENLSEFIYLNMSLFSAQPTNSVRAGTLSCPPFYRPGAWMSI